MTGSTRVLLLMVGVLAFTVFAGSASAGPQEGGPSAVPEAQLTKLRERLAFARTQSRVKARQAIQEAITAKEGFVQELFNAPGQSLFGCSNSAKLLLDLERIDLELEIAADEKSAKARGFALDNAVTAGKQAVSRLSQCDGADPIDKRQANELLDKVKGIPPNAEKDQLQGFVTKVAAKKAELLADQRIYGCKVVMTYTLVKEIDVLAGLARTQGTKQRNKTLDKAIDEVDHLVDEVKLMPCGETIPPTPDPEPQPQGCATAQSVVFSPTERQFNIGNCGYGKRQSTVDITSLSLTVAGNTITNELPPAGGSCTSSNSGGNGTYSCTGSMGQSLSLNLDFLNSPAGQSASYSVNGGQYSGSIPIP